MEEQQVPADLVITYVVRENAEGDVIHSEVKEALGKGYRVVDVISTSVSAGGDCKYSGFCSVTVVLTKFSADCLYKKSFK